MGQKIGFQFTNKGQDIDLTTEIDTDNIEDIIEYKERPNYCEIIHWVNGQRVTHSVNESQESLRSKLKPFSTRMELDVEAIMSDFSEDGDL